VFLVVGQTVGNRFIIAVFLSRPFFTGQGLAFARFFLSDNFNIVFTKKIKEFLDGPRVFYLIGKKFIEVLKGDTAFISPGFQEIIFYIRKHRLLLSVCAQPQRF
jgi:uncharacterized protein YybS (DUF2232 family)